MSQSSFSERLCIKNKRGLHARASAKFVQTVDQFDADVQVSKDGHTVCGTSIMGLMMLAAAPGCHIDVVTSGNQAEDALKAISTLIEDRFGEGEQSKRAGLFALARCAPQKVHQDVVFSILIRATFALQFDLSDPFKPLCKKFSPPFWAHQLVALIWFFPDRLALFLISKKPFEVLKMHHSC